MYTARTVSSGTEEANVLKGRGRSEIGLTRP